MKVGLDEMKTIFSVLMMLLVAAFASGQTVYLPEATLAWDPSPGLVDGTPFAAGDVVQYEVARQEKGGGLIELLGTTEGLAYHTVLPDDRVKYVYLVRAKLTTDEGQTVLFSEYALSPFDLRHPSTTRPGEPGGIRIE